MKNAENHVNTGVSGNKAGEYGLKAACRALRFTKR